LISFPNEWIDNFVTLLFALTIEIDWQGFFSTLIFLSCIFSLAFVFLPSSLILQIYNNYQGVFNEDYNIANTPAPSGKSCENML
jgi:hypothetical protein